MDDDTQPPQQPLESWESCYERLAPKLVLFARQWLRNAQDAEDAVQEAFIRVWKQQHTGQRFQDSYYFAATRTAAIDHGRSASRRQIRETTSLEEAGVDLAQPQFEAAAAAAPAICGQDIEDAMAAVPPEQRETVVLRIWGGQTFAEIALITGVSLDTAASRYRYGIAAMKKYFNLTTP
ncbi:MAG: RNA polymerase sigma factor [Candidatus Methylacidiphilales bacterium]|nr:RNA polymerase sigma factor [Candidatus Methylacidiphilales bacterium]